VFLKTAPASADWRLDSEADGLAALAAAGALRVPAVRARGLSAGTAWLALEWLDLSAGSARTAVRLGEGLACLHLQPRPRFGWPRDNALGAALQRNGESDEWAEFFARQRIGAQLDLAEANGLGRRLLEAGRRLQDRVPALLAGRHPAPALLHGDLWGGNWGAVDGEPVLFDPAVYCGDPEAELAMTRLFGGFAEAFYEAYAALLPSAPGAGTRNRLYQLYHVLNHANLFGGGYTAQAARMIDELLAELG
jgi:fructosamine-3-kinase